MVQLTRNPFRGIIVVLSAFTITLFASCSKESTASAEAKADPEKKMAQTGPENIQYAADPAELTETQLQKEAEIFDALDLTRPELSAVAAAWAKKDHAAARKAFATYLRTRTNVSWQQWSTKEMPKELTSKVKSIADNAAEGKLVGGLVNILYAFPNGDVDWHFDATTKVPGNAPNNEWTWQLNRMSFWQDMAVAYRGTGDEKYAKAFVKQVRSWIQQCPVPMDKAANGPGSAWRTIEAGIRPAWNWPGGYFGFLHSPSMSDFDLVAFVGAFMDHAHYLTKFHTRFNWLTMEMNGLYSVGVLFPEFKDAKQWRMMAINSLAKEAQEQFYPDGAQKEISTGYQNVAIDNISRIPEVAGWNNLQSELPSSYMSPLEMAYEWQMYLAAPDRQTPRINDSWPNDMRRTLKKGLKFFPNRADFKWFVSEGKEGAAPSKTSVFLPWSGLAAMRSGWESDANYYFFRPGPIGAGHCHQDGLTVNAWAYGKCIVYSGSGGSYEKSKWRTYATSSYSQNVVIVDGLPQCAPTEDRYNPPMVTLNPVDAKWQSTPTFDFASGTYDQGYSSGPWKKNTERLFVTQQRDVLFLKPDLFIIADRLKPQDSVAHTYQARWQLFPTNTKIDPATKALVTLDEGQPNLAIVPLLSQGLEVSSASGQETPELLGWDVRKDTTPQQAPTTSLLHTIKGTGEQYFLTLFVPLKAGEKNPVTKVESDMAKQSAKITFADGRHLTVSINPSLGISVQETLANGQAGRSAKVSSK